MNVDCLNKYKMLLSDEDHPQIVILFDCINSIKFNRESINSLISLPDEIVFLQHHIHKLIKIAKCSYPS